MTYRERLKEAAKWIDRIASGGHRPGSPEFNRWQSRTRQNLQGLIGASNQLFHDFGNLHFCVPRMRAPGDEWDARDEAEFKADVERAKGIIEDALEDEGLGVAAKPAPAAPAAPPPPRHVVVINNNLANVLSNVVNVNVDQLIQELRRVDLTEGDRTAAEEAARELSKEIDSRQRWDEVSKWAGRLWKLGEPVIRTVGVPLLMKYLKTQAGIA